MSALQGKTHGPFHESRPLEGRDGIRGIDPPTMQAAVRMACHTSVRAILNLRVEVPHCSRAVARSSAPPSPQIHAWSNTRVLLLALGLAFAFQGGVGCVEIRPPVSAARYVAFGDSATRGPSDRDYPDILCELLGESPEACANEGGSGERTDEGLVRLKDFIRLGVYPDMEVLLYWQGGNDITDFAEDHDPLFILSPDDPDYFYDDELVATLDEIQASIESAIAAAQNTGFPVYVATYYLLSDHLAECNPMPLNLLIFSSQADVANAYVVMLNERIRQAVVNRRAAAPDSPVVLVDVETLDGTLRADPDNYFNCNHLSEQGNEIVAQLFFDRIQETSE